MNGKVQGAQSFARTMALLQRIADSESPPGLTELLGDGELTRPTLYRMLASLETEGLVRRTEDRRYRLGTRLVSLAHRALAQHDIRTAAHEALMTLRDATGETVHLAVRSDDQMVYIDKIESRETVRMASGIGTRVAFHSSSVGRAFLCALPVAESDAVLGQLELTRFTPRTPTSQARVRTLLTQGRKLGYCMESEENEAGIVCFGAAIVDAGNRPVAAVSVSVPMFRKAEDDKRYWQPLVRCCAQISSASGWIGTT